MSAFVQNEKNGLIYMTSPVIGAKHAFSTRFGGVSEGGLASLNLGFNRGDVRERVIENYRLLGAALGLDVMRAAYTKQVHGTHVRLVTDADRCGPTDPAQVGCRGEDVRDALTCAWLLRPRFTLLKLAFASRPTACRCCCTTPRAARRARSTAAGAAL